MTFNKIQDINDLKRFSFKINWTKKKWIKLRFFFKLNLNENIILKLFSNLAKWFIK